MRRCNAWGRRSRPLTPPHLRDMLSSPAELRPDPDALSVGCGTGRSSANDDDVERKISTCRRGVQRLDEDAIGVTAAPYRGGVTRSDAARCVSERSDERAVGDILVEDDLVDAGPKPLRADNARSARGGAVRVDHGPQPDRVGPVGSCRSLRALRSGGASGAFGALRAARTGRAGLAARASLFRAAPQAFAFGESLPHPRCRRGSRPRR